MAGRVIRGSRGTFNGSTKGWRKGIKRDKGQTSPEQAKKDSIAKHTVKQANKAGRKGALRSLKRGAVNGAKKGFTAGVTVTAMALVTNQSGPKSALKFGALATGAGVAFGAVGGAAASRPIRSYKASAGASAALGLANRKTAIDRRAGVSRSQSMSSTYKTYNRASRAASGFSAGIKVKR